MKAQYQQSDPIFISVSEINQVSKHLNSDRISNAKLDPVWKSQKPIESKGRHTLQKVHSWYVYKDDNFQDTRFTGFYESRKRHSSIFSNLKLIFKSYTTRFLQYWKQALLFDKQNKNIVLLRSEPMLKWGSTNNKSVYFGGKILSLQ